MKRKSYIVVLMACLLGMVLVGCSNDTGTTPPASTNAPSTNMPSK
jgi:hypothetical protein